MIIQIDTREKARTIQNILRYFDQNSIKHISSKLYVGDYMNMDRPQLIIDRKHNLAELCVNVCQQHSRFAAELARAKEAGIHIIILCEHGGKIKTLDDVRLWENPRLKDHPLAVSGERLHKILCAMMAKYEFEIHFCDKRATGRRIIELLS